MNIYQESNYRILLTEDDRLVIHLKWRDTFQKDEFENGAFIMYGGGVHAILKRDLDNIIILDYIHPDARNYINDQNDIIIFESHCEDLIDDYEVPVQKVPKAQMELILLTYNKISDDIILDLPDEDMQYSQPEINEEYN